MNGGSEANDDDSCEIQGEVEIGWFCWVKSVEEAYNGDKWGR